MQSSFERYRSLDQQKREIVRDAVLHHWTSKQKERLLASTGSRLSGLGADLRGVRRMYEWMDEKGKTKK